MELSSPAARPALRRPSARTPPATGPVVDPGRAARKVGAARRLAIYSAIRRRRLSRTDLVRHGVAFAVALVVHALVVLGVLAFFAALPPPGERASDPRGLVVSLEEPASPADASAAAMAATGNDNGNGAPKSPSGSPADTIPGETDPNRFADPDQLARDIDAQARPVVPSAPPATPAGGSLAAAAAAAGLTPAAAVNTKGMNRGDYYALVNERLARTMGGSGGITGQLVRVVPVRFTIGADGRIVGTWLLGSSGDPRVDQRALAMLRAAGPFPPIPASVGSDRLDMTYRVSVAG